MPTTKLNKFSIEYHNSEEYHVVKREIFTDEIYYFETDAAQPVIFDLGAHIGLATLYFKYLYPFAQVTAVEPHPTNYKLLETNMWHNDFRDVQTIQAAVTAETSQTITLHADTEHDWFSTASLQSGAWSSEQQTQPLKVPTIRLSELLQPVEHVDLLKVDIEGYEQSVLAEAQSQLHKVSQLLIEFHPVQQQDYHQLWKFLEQQGYAVSSTKQHKHLHYPNQLQLLMCTRR